MQFDTPAGAAESEVAFLGTGSAMPSKYRNVSGMLVRLWPTPAPPPPPSATAAAAAPISPGAAAAAAVAAETKPATPMAAAAAAAAAPGGGESGSEFEGGGSILLDAGEGSMGQLWRMFGDSSSSNSGGGNADNSGKGHGGGSGRYNADGRGSGGGGGAGTGAQQVLRDLSAVWISHPHADHHLGLVKILSERNKLLTGGCGAGAAGRGARLPNLLLMAPAPVASWLQVSRTDAGRKGSPSHRPCRSWLLCPLLAVSLRR